MIATEKKSVPIIFTVNSINKILTGKKVMTRRIIKPLPEMGNEPIIFKKCRYGYPGNKLWIKEPWQYSWSSQHQKNCVIYKATPGFQNTNVPQNIYERGIECTWRSPIYMPKWARRIELDILQISYERIQSISNYDILKEGLDLSLSLGPEKMERDTRRRFINEWDSINSKRGYGWEKNNWVWVISFQC